MERLSASDSDQYFKVRPRDSQITALASDQSQTVASRGALENAWNHAEREFGDKEDVPRPEHWGGYRLIPEMFEFWQGQTNRLHDRIRFRRADPDEDPDPIVTKEGERGWVYERLAP